MPVVAGDLKLYGAASRPENDTTTSGGAIDLQVGHEIAELTGDVTVRVVSDGADTRDVRLTIRQPSGVVMTETKALAGATPVNFDTTARAVEKFEIFSTGTTNVETSATRTVQLQEQTGGNPVVSTMPINRGRQNRQFLNLTSGASPKDAYEKAFFKNENGTSALLLATVELVSHIADPDNGIQMALETMVNGTNSSANRVTAPTGITAWADDDGTKIGVPGTDLAAGAAIGVWLRTRLGANDAPFRGSNVVRLEGSTA